MTSREIIYIDVNSKCTQCERNSRPPVCADGGGAGASMHCADPHAPPTKVKLDVIARLFSIFVCNRTARYYYTPHLPAQQTAIC